MDMDKTLNAVLHELRSSGAEGLTEAELNERLPGWRERGLGTALSDGRVTWTNDRPARLRLTACQRALDEAENARIVLEDIRATLGISEGTRAACVTEIAVLFGRLDEAIMARDRWCKSSIEQAQQRALAERERDEALAAEEALRRGVENAMAGTLVSSSGVVREIRHALQAALDGASAKGVHLLERLDEAEEKARLWGDHSRSTACGREIARLTTIAHAQAAEIEQLKTIVGARALSAIAHAIEAAQ